MGRRLLFAGAALGLVVPALALAQANQLNAVTGPGFSIAMTRADGSPVTQLDPGSFQVNVDDRGDEHNFHLTGPGVDMSTSVTAIERVTWQLTFVEGRYRFICDAHPLQMRGDFVVGNPPAPPPPPPPPPPAPPPVRRITATVGPGATIRVAPRSVRAGRAVITVNDRTAAHNFHLTGRGVNRRTGVAFRGRSRWTLTLRRGVYRYRSDARPALAGTLRVT